MNWIIVGGAPLSRETHEFIRVCLGAIVVQVSKKYITGMIQVLIETFSIFFGTDVIFTLRATA